MATRYLAIISRSGTPPLRPSSHFLSLPEFRQTSSPAGTAVYVNSGDYIVLPGECGVIIGRLFESTSPPRPVRAIGSADAGRICGTRGRHLVSQFWGGYLAILSDANGGWHAIRDPSGAMPAYYLKRGNTLVVASDADLLTQAGLLVPAIDWQNLSAHLAARDLRTQDTCLAGLSELMPGSRLPVPADRAEPVWSPWDYTASPAGQTGEVLAGNLSRTLNETVQALAGGYGRILLGVSGGLDSSIVAACLKANHADLHCFTMATREPEGDERVQARGLCTHLDLPLIERFHDFTLVDIERATSAHLPRPVGHPFGQSVTGIKHELAASLGTEALFSGVGGDNVFCFTQSATPLVDRFRARGIEPGLLTTLLDICRQNQCSIGDALQMAIERQRRKDPRYVWEGDRKFLASVPSDDPKPRLYHPWLDLPAGALPGKAVHIAMLARLQGTNDGMDRSGPPQLLPLVSQPVMEACLAIPTWEWVGGGRNRAVARQAFRNVLPASVLDRQSKGGPNTFAYQVMERHKAALCERLTCGRLAQAGLLDIEAIRRAMAPSRLIVPPDHMYLSHLAEAEAWVRHWEGKGAALSGNSAAAGRSS